MYQFSDQTEGKETVFTIKSQDVKFGVGALRELWSDARSLGMNQIALFPVSYTHLRAHET